MTRVVRSPARLSRGFRRAYSGALFLECQRQCRRQSKLSFERAAVPLIARVVDRYDLRSS